MKSGVRRVPKTAGETHEARPVSVMLTGAKDPLELLLRHYIDAFVTNNPAARVVREGLRVLGVGIRPVVDHLTFRTMHIDKRAKEFLGFGYVYDTKLGAIAYSSWWMKVYRKEGYPSISITQAFNGKRGEASAIPVWVKTFGDNMLHHMAIQVDDIEQAVYYLEKQGIAFVGKIIGDRSSDLRRIFTQPVIKKNRVYTVLELTERHRGYQGIVPPQADQLMKAK